MAMNKALYFLLGGGLFSLQLSRELMCHFMRRGDTRSPNSHVGNPGSESLVLLPSSLSLRWKRHNTEVIQVTISYNALLSDGVIFMNSFIHSQRELHCLNVKVYEEESFSFS